jgi:hypothetical protein
MNTVLLACADFLRPTEDELLTLSSTIAAFHSEGDFRAEQIRINVGSGAEVSANVL